MRSRRAQVAATGVAVLLLGCVDGKRAYIPPGLAPDLDAAIRAGDSRAVTEMGLSALESHLGSRFPQATLTRPGETIILPDDVHGDSVALLWAGGPCSLTMVWLDALERDGWRVEGTDRLMIAILPVRPPEIVQRVPPDQPLHSMEFPLPEFLQYVYWYPQMMFLDAEGRLVGYQNSPEGSAVRWPRSQGSP